MNKSQELLKGFDPEFHEAFVIPMEKLGFELKKFKSMEFDDEGVHIFLYKFPADISPETWKKVKEHLTEDDDSQPHSTYSCYLRDVWHFVPYYK